MKLLKIQARRSFGEAQVENKFESLSHDMPFLFSLLSFARGILAFGDLFLLLLGGFLMIAVRLAAPIMIAVAIDRNLAQRMSYPLLWGVIVLTLVWPAVAQLIRAFAYMGGNLAMSLDASDYVYQWNPQIMQEIMTSGAEPYHTVILAFEVGFRFTSYSQRSNTSDRNLHLQRSGGAQQMQLCDDLAGGRQRKTQSDSHRKSSSDNRFRASQVD
jgi:hypothetical protein